MMPITREWPAPPDGPKTVQDRVPNFRNETGSLFLVRCFACKGHEARGRENWAPSVSSGTCAHCGWDEAHLEGGHK